MGKWRALLIEKLKGETYVDEKIVDSLVFEGIVPATQRYSEEPCRLRVCKISQTTKRDAWWARPEVKTVYHVYPMSTHFLPFDCRCRTIFVSEPAPSKRVEADSLLDAAKSYCLWLHNERSQFEEKVKKDHAT